MDIFGNVTPCSLLEGSGVSKEISASIIRERKKYIYGSVSRQEINSR
jgi:hypothetical protein